MLLRYGVGRSARGYSEVTDGPGDLFVVYQFAVRTVLPEFRFGVSIIREGQVDVVLRVYIRHENIEVVAARIAKLSCPH